MDRAQEWVTGFMERMGLQNVVREPFMNYGASWDNEFFSLHMTAPARQTLVGYPIAHTPGTDGPRELDVVIADVRMRSDLDSLRGQLAGKAVLSTPPALIDRARFATGTPPRTDEEMRGLAEAVLARTEPDPVFESPYADSLPHPDLLTPVAKLDFYREEGVAVVLESRSGWPGAVRGFARPGAKVDQWDRAATRSVEGAGASVREGFGDAGAPETGKGPDYDNRAVYFNQDYGRGGYRGIWLEENGHVRAVFEAWMAPFHDFGMTTLAPGRVGSTDHVPFDDVGLPGFQFLQSRVGGTGGHTNLDFYDTLPVADLKKNAVVVAAFAYHAAMADRKLPRKGSGRQ